MSERMSIDVPLHCSGDIYKGVPFELVTEDKSLARAIPKSVTLGEPSAAKRTL